ncbi:hypothetical protein [Flavobacterium sp. JP2137]|uniref:hypothetical protein n=1 Tax=Flavobacterium sp. JP2137 TaxID=3414510 RepID=UPI003D2FECE6
MKKLFYINIGLLFAACGPLITTSNYNDLPDGWKERVVPLTTFEEVKMNQITKINGNQLREELKKHPKAIVHTLANGCSSNLSLEEYEQFAVKNGYKLFIVMLGYEYTFLTYNQKRESPLYSIDTDYYTQKRRSVYGKNFLNDLLGRGINEKIEYEADYVFEYGQLMPGAGSKLKFES